MGSPLTMVHAALVVAVHLVVTVVGASTTCPAAPQAATAIDYFMSSAPLASADGARGCGAMNDTAAFLSDTCRNGVVDALNIVKRHAASTSGAVPSVFLPMVDRSSVFTKTHPLGWGVNIKLLAALNVTHYLAQLPFATPDEAVAAAFPSVPSYLVDGASFPVANLLTRFITRLFSESASTSTIAIVPHRRFFEGYEQSVATTKILAAAAWQQPCVRHVIVVTDEADPAALARDLTTSVSAADAVSVVVSYAAPSSTAVSMPAVAGGAAGTATRLDASTSSVTPWVVKLRLNSKYLHRVRLTLSNTADAATSRRSITNVTVTAEPLLVPAAEKDAAYIAAQRLVHAEIEAATINDKTLANLTAPIPNPVDPGPPGLRCITGECENGDMWADAFRWSTPGAHAGLLLAQSLRSSNLGPGSVTLQNLYKNYPFSNDMCVADVLGLTLFYTLQAGVAANSFLPHESTRSKQALLQVSGLRLVVDLSQPKAEDRLRSVSVHDNATNMYRPLQRLAMYRVATISFLCNAAPPFASILRSKLPGTSTVNIDTRRSMHVMAGNFMASFPAGYTPGTNGRYTITNTSSSSSTNPSMYQQWHQTAASCNVATEMFNEALLSCVACAGGQCHPDNSALSTTHVIMIAAASVTAIGLGIAVVVYFLSQRGHKNNSNAPTDQTKPFAIAFTDIQASTNLWATAPEAMSASLDIHHEVLRAAIAMHDGYEVKTIGDAFMVAFSTAQQAVAFSTDVQETLFKSDWGPLCGEIEEVYTEWAASENLPLGDYGVRWNGLRVRVGVHFGHGEIKFDETSKGYDYYGTVVNTAARVEAVGHGGQVLVTASAYEAACGAQKSLCQGIVAAEIGSQDLRGLSDPVELVQLLPVALSSRQFPALRLDKVGHTAADANPNASDPTESHSNTGSIRSSSTHIAVSAAAANTDPGAVHARALLATLPSADKLRVAGILAKRWHIPIPSERTLRRDAVALEGVISLIGGRAGQSVVHAGPHGHPKATRRSDVARHAPEVYKPTTTSSFLDADAPVSFDGSFSRSM